MATGTRPAPRAAPTQCSHYWDPPAPPPVPRRARPARPACHPLAKYSGWMHSLQVGTGEIARVAHEALPAAQLTRDAMMRHVVVDVACRMSPAFTEPLHPPNQTGSGNVTELPGERRIARVSSRAVWPRQVGAGA